MSKCTPILVSLLISTCCNISSLRAEVYRDIGPLDTLGDLKQRFPGAVFKRESPAWAQESDVMYSITGEGLSGTIVVKFTDFRPLWKEMANETAISAGGAEQSGSTAEDTRTPEQRRLEALDSSAAETYRQLAKSDESTITVDWVRWVPERPIPLERFITKYGPPDVNGFSDEDLEPYKSWTSRGLMTFLSDDGKRVLRVDYAYTLSEQRSAWKAKRGFIPDWLRSNPVPHSAEPKKSSRKPTQL